MAVVTPPKNANIRWWLPTSRGSAASRSPRRRCSCWRRGPDEELHLDALPRRRVDDRRLLPGVIDEDLLAGPVVLTHREADGGPATAGSSRRTGCTGSRPGAVRGTPGGAAPASPGPLALGVDPGTIRQGAPAPARIGHPVEAASRTSSASCWTWAQSRPAWVARRRTLVTTPTLTCRLAATSRWLRAKVHFWRRISRSLRMDSRSVAIRSFLGSGWRAGPSRAAGATRPPLPWGPIVVGRSASVERVQHGRSSCSR